MRRLVLLQIKFVDKVTGECLAAVHRPGGLNGEMSGDMRASQAHPLPALLLASIASCRPGARPLQTGWQHAGPESSTSAGAGVQATM